MMSEIYKSLYIYWEVLSFSIQSICNLKAKSIINFPEKKNPTKK